MLCPICNMPTFEGSILSYHGAIVTPCRCVPENKIASVRGNQVTYIDIDEFKAKHCAVQRAFGSSSRAFVPKLSIVKRIEHRILSWVWKQGESVLHLRIVLARWLESRDAFFRKAPLYRSAQTTLVHYGNTERLSSGCVSGRTGRLIAEAHASGQEKEGTSPLKVPTGDLNLYVWETVRNGKKGFAVSTGFTVEEARGKLAEVTGFDSQEFDSAPLKLERGAGLLYQQRE